MTRPRKRETWKVYNSQNTGGVGDSVVFRPGWENKKFYHDSCGSVQIVFQTFSKSLSMSIVSICIPDGVFVLTCTWILHEKSMSGFKKWGLDSFTHLEASRYGVGGSCCGARTLLALNGRLCLRCLASALFAFPFSLDRKILRSQT